MIVRPQSQTPEARLSLLVDRLSGVVVEPKPYIRPFERCLAAAELRGLTQGGPPSLHGNTTGHALLSPDVDAQRLVDRLAYWQRIGGEHPRPTLQVRLEATATDDPERMPRKRLLRYGPHGLHEYRGKFFPQLVRSLVNAAGLEPGSVVVDPMCGSGTTPCEARVLGMRAVGLDLNPLSVRIASVKSAVLDFEPGQVAAAARTVLQRAATLEPEPNWAKADEEYLLRWFDAKALAEIGAIQHAIGKARSEELRQLFSVCLSNVIREVSWQKQADLRVRKEVTQYERGNAQRAFAREVTQQVERLVPYLRALRERAGELPAAEIREGDARQADRTLRSFEGACDLLVSSPPYAMALPYLDTDRLSLSVLGLLPRVGQRRRDSEMVGNREITEGRRVALWEHYQARRECLPGRVCKLVDALGRANHGDEVGFRRRNLPALLAKYFLDMRDVFTSTRRLMKPGAYAYWVVGNNSTEVRGDRVEIPTDELLFELAASVGWKQHETLDMELLSSRDIFRRNRGSAETILGFRAGPQRKAVYGAIGVDEGGDWDFKGADTQEHLHSIHPYPARFIPQIPRLAIRRYAKPGQRVLDPFAGGGTTLLEAALAGCPSVGVDNNAVAHLVAVAKTQRYQPKDVRALYALGRRIDGESLDAVRPAIPDYTNRDYWFSGAALEDLGRLRAVIDGLPVRPRRFALAVFSAIVLRASRQDSDTRYARIERNYVPGSASRWFASKLSKALTRLDAVRELLVAPVECHLGDSRELDFIDHNSIDLLVTSPPYLNAYDYHKYHRHRLHWIDGDVAMARDREIGKHDTYTRPRARPEPYFENLGQCMNEWARVLRPGAVALVVVGDAIVGGQPVAVGDRMTEQFEERGFRVEARELRKLDTKRKSFNQRARIDREHVIVARRLD
jgi:site-specific DNA-methyltransferase (cytosine-N4-specific)